VDEVERLIAAFGARGKRNQSTWKLDILMDLACLDEPGVVSFLQVVITDQAEPEDVRIEALKRLRTAPLRPADRVRVADSSLRVLRWPRDEGLRLYTALALGDFVDVPGVLDGLGALTRDLNEALELRYTTFTSLQRAGPTAECLALLRELSGDDTLGRSVRAVLVAWGAGGPD
jgi:hypothetical protein